MDTPNLHDDNFEGVCSAEKVVHMFIKGMDGKRCTVIFKDVECMKLNEVMDGNIMSELRIIRTEDLKLADMEEMSLGGDRDVHLDLRLKTARARSLSVGELHTSYGAHGKILFRDIEVVSGYVLPPQTV